MRQLLTTLALTSALLSPGVTEAAKKPLYKNPKAPIEVRVDDLLSRMTLHEKVQQLQNNSVRKDCPVRSQQRLWCGWRLWLDKRRPS